MFKRSSIILIFVLSFNQCICQDNVVNLEQRRIQAKETGYTDSEIDRILPTYESFLSAKTVTEKNEKMVSLKIV